MLLAIDTATAQISLALHDGHGVMVETTWLSANNHTVELAPAVIDTLKRADLTIDGLTALAVAIGPGSYSALRIGVAFAKGIAAARGLPLLGMNTLDILAASQPKLTGVLMPVIAAGRGRVSAAPYAWSDADSRWNASAEPENYAWGALIAKIAERADPTLITGEVDAAGAAAIAAARTNGITVTLAPSSARLRRAGYLAQNAWDQLHALTAAENINLAEKFSAAAITPVYVKTG